MLTYLRYDLATFCFTASVGAAAWRLGRRFTLRAAIIATAVVAGLLGMAVEM